MKCPVCISTTLLLDECQGVKIDYCPKCRGAWLYKGELDKIIERSALLDPTQIAPPAGDSKEPPIENHDSHHGRPYQKKFWLGEICD